MKKTNQFARIVFAVLFSVSVLTLSGCSEKPNEIAAKPAEEIFKISEVQAATDTAQIQEEAASPVIRDFSDTERERMETLKQSYNKEEIYPDKLILEVNSAEDVTEGTLCYIRTIGNFYLPNRELTDEELLEIIDCNFRIAIGQSAAAQEARTAYEAEQARLRKIVEDNNGIRGDEAIELAAKQVKEDLGAKADELELMADNEGIGWDLMSVSDIDENGKLCTKASVIYDVGFGNPSTHYTYGYVIDAIDGSILNTWSSEDMK